ncbi:MULTISPECIES: hypothetical protein [unclassified Prochlorococcus]|nr:MULTISPECIES: hypothetical protein [unclassified Prochlorococcus]NMO83786.1 hypothetical protein [Prochlorococcus sp. P1344]NMP12433.1 hypothetical protein [Prochlorococcus sp.P1363]
MPVNHSLESCVVQVLHTACHHTLTTHGVLLFAEIQVGATGFEPAT